MKVLQINSVIDYGSTGRITRNLYDYLVDHGHDCVIAFGRGNTTLGYKTIKIGSKIDQLCHGIYSRLTDRHGFASKRATEDLIRQIDAYNPDIIQLHNLHGYYLNIEVLFNYLAKKDIPVVWLLHDQWAVSGHSANFNLDENGKIPDHLMNREELNNYPKTLIFSQFEKNLASKKKLFTSVKNMVIITPSKWLANIVKNSFLNKYPIKTIYNGIDTKVFKIDLSQNIALREKWGATNKVVILGVASVWTESKGINDFIELSKTLNYSEYQIVLVGIDKKTRMKLPENIITIERTNSVEELRAIYNASDVFVNPTYFDNFPTVNLEAMACGIPVITYDTGGSPESIDITTGCIVEQGNINELANQIERFGKKNKKSIESCRKRVGKLFSKQVCYKKYKEIYEQCLFQE
ncbi:MAG: glycosyltransferase [Facklamia hominis]